MTDHTPQDHSAPSAPEPVPLRPKHRFTKRKKIIIFVLVAIILVSGAMAAWIAIRAPGNNTNSSTNNSEANSQGTIESTEDLRKAVDEIKELKAQDDSRLQQLDSYLQ